MGMLLCPCRDREYTIPDMMAPNQPISPLQVAYVPSCAVENGHLKLQRIQIVGSNAGKCMPFMDPVCLQADALDIAEEICCACVNQQTSLSLMNELDLYVYQGFDL